MRVSSSVEPSFSTCSVMDMLENLELILEMSDLPGAALGWYWLMVMWYSGSLLEDCGQIDIGDRCVQEWHIIFNGKARKWKISWGKLIRRSLSIV